MSTPPYPRPDFIRPNLRWSSLDGPWEFLFDDQDVGLRRAWQHSGLPSRVQPDEENPVQAEPKTEKRTINVPFVFQTPASGLNERGAHEVIWYERFISDIRTDDEIAKGFRLLVRFGAVDYEATVWVDGHYVGEHRGGHVPFDIDVTDPIQYANAEGPRRLTLRVRDSPSDLAQPRGKQYWAAEPESIFYTPSSGIWQSVWLESVPPTRIGDASYGTILRSDDIENGELQGNIAIVGRRVGEKYIVKAQAELQGVFVAKLQTDALEASSAPFKLGLRLPMEHLKELPSTLLEKAPLNQDYCWRDGLALWSPEYPLLYDLTVSLHNQAGVLLDEVKTTAGMRALSWSGGDSSFRLNGKRYFQTLVLDQGYWPDTGITPPSQESLRRDIELSKQMGFNGCRKHQKVEDPVFLYWADRLGYVVWGEMANAYKFSEEYVSRFDQEWKEAVKRDLNHPCIVTWTPVNESWGYGSLGESVEQRSHIRSLYYMTKTMDPTRPINDNCGWEHVCTDLTTFHDYSDGPMLASTCNSMEGILQPKSNQKVFVEPISTPLVNDPGARHKDGAPVICTEFGGVNIAPATGQNKEGSKDWGYTTASDPEDLLKRIEKLVMGVVEGGYCCGLVYTQLTDIEQEVNGLYSFDRREKLDSKKVKAVMEAAKKVYYDKFPGE